MQDVAARDGDVGVAIHLTGSDTVDEGVGLDDVTVALYYPQGIRIHVRALAAAED